MMCVPVLTRVPCDQVLDEIHRATKASLLAIVASHALLMAFALKLKMSSALSRRAAAARGKRPNDVNAFARCLQAQALPYFPTIPYPNCSAHAQEPSMRMRSPGA